MANEKEVVEVTEKEVTSAVSSGAAAEPVKDPFFVPAPDVPTQKGPKGIRFDFNDGARVLLPKGQWHVQLEDDDSGNVLFVCDADEGWVTSAKKYYVPFRIKVWDRRNLAKPVLDHVMDLKDKPVLIKYPVGTLGDLIGWFPYAEKFQQKIVSEKGTTYAAYNYDGYDYKEWLKENNIKIKVNKKVWDRIPFGNISLAHDTQISTEE